uniref:Major facilitator superfamily (MFS) profile domain-containing protein n=1 Tax=Acrobeloides nanus TaxID=290746 RepID=A0A914CFF4_9BILA
MAGGVAISTATSGIPQPSHQPKLGWFIYVMSAMAVIGAFLFGYDTGMVTAALLYLPDNGGMKPMDNFWKELIVSITPGMASVGSLLAGPASDKFGRKKVIVTASVTFLIGGLICAAAFNKWILLIGRVILGIAI